NSKVVTHKPTRLSLRCRDLKLKLFTVFTPNNGYGARLRQARGSRRVRNLGLHGFGYRWFSDALIHPRYVLPPNRAILIYSHGMSPRDNARPQCFLLCAIALAIYQGKAS